MRLYSIRQVVVRLVRAGAVSAACAGLPAAAADGPEEEGVVVTASRSAVEEDRLGSAVTVIPREVIEANRERLVTDILRSVPGLDVVTSGGPGGNASVFLRGASSEHTLVLVDGREINDPSSSNRSFNFSQFTPDNIERIEVVRGPQSTLYGSDALGGVVNIITRRGRGAPAADVSVEAGSYRSFVETASLAGGTEATGTAGAYDYSLGLSRHDLDGVSSAERRDGNREDDGLGVTGASARGGLVLPGNLRLDNSVRMNDGRTDIDAAGGPGGDDPDRHVTNRATFLRSALSGSYFGGRFVPKLDLGYNRQRFTDDDDPDEARPFERLRSSYAGRLLEFEASGTVKASDSVTVVAGAETEDEKADTYFISDGAFGPFSDVFPGRSLRTNGYFGEVRLGSTPEAGGTVGVRHDDNARFGGKTTWRLAPYWSPDGGTTKVRASAGTGFKTPSLYQLFSQYGREDLRPEKSRGWDVGVDTKAGSATTLSLTYFANRLDDLISYDPSTFVFENIGRATTSGVEAGLASGLTDRLSCSVSYTYTDARSDSAGGPLLRRPKNKAFAEVAYAATPALTVTANVRAFGARADADFSSGASEPARLGGYVVTGLGVTYAATRNVDVFARADNVFDKEYSEVLGYGTLGAAAFGGVRVRF